MSETFDFDALFTPLPEPTAEELQILQNDINQQKAVQSTDPLKLGLPECALFPKKINIPYPTIVKELSSNFNLPLPYVNGLNVPDELTKARPNLALLPYNPIYCEIFLNFVLTDSKIQESLSKCNALIGNVLTKNKNVIQPVKETLNTLVDTIFTNSVKTLINRAPENVRTRINNFELNLRTKLNSLEKSIANNVCNKLASSIQKLPKEQRTCDNIRNLLEGNVSFC